MNRRMNLVGALFGLGFGFVLAAARLNDYSTIHNMLRLRQGYVFWFMGSAIGLALPLLWLLERRRVTTLYGGPLVLSRSKPQRHHVVGGGLFGLGWAVAGTCPGPALAMVSSGAALGLVTVTGLFVGIHLRDWHVRHHVTLADGEHNWAAVAAAELGADVSPAIAP